MTARRPTAASDFFDMSNTVRLGGFLYMPSQPGQFTVEPTVNL